MQELNEKVEKPKILGPKPNIASKPKHVPPVNLVKGQKINRDDVCKTNLPRQTNANNDFRHQQKEMSKDAQTSMDKNITGTEKIYDRHAIVTGSTIPLAENFQSYVHIQRPINFPCSITDTYGDSNQDYEKQNVSYSEYTSYYSEKCDKYKTTCESHKFDDNHKHPTSPSTVCCSILSNTSNDCCGIIVNAAKKELNGKTLTKVESTDSNSSDSGGFKDFVQLDISKTANQVISHQRKISQPEFLEKKNDYVKPYTHQRNSSQPDYISSEIRQPLIINKQTFVANAQALAQYLPQTEHKFLCKTSSTNIERPEDIRQVVSKLNVAQVSQMFNEKTEDNKTQSKPRQQIITQSQFQQSTKKIEELLSQRLEKERLMRKGQNCLVDGEGSQDIEHKMVLQKQINQKLHADLQQTVKHIQEIQSIELRLPQNRKWTESNRSQPAIGLKHTPKSRPTIFGTVASDHTPKDCSNRRSLPQTPQPKSFSIYNNGEAMSENLSDTTMQHDKALVYRDSNLISGSLDALIQHLVPTDVYYPDRAYIFAFLLSSRLYIKPHDLLDTIRSLSESQQGLGVSGKIVQPGSIRFAEHLVQLLAEWTETFPYDFRDERVMQHVRTITQHCCALNTALRANVSSLLHNLLQRLTALETYERSLETPTVPIDENCVDITELCPHTGDLAQQLTHVELERLSYIGPEEFVQAFAKENPHLETSFKDMKKTHNLEQYVQWFNRLSYFVATQVCRYPKKKQRVKVVEYWIEVGRECFNIGNFNSLMAIIAGLNMSPISRLKKTWNKIHSGKFAILEHQMDPSSNFSSYRSTLKAAMWRSAGATDQRQRIVIPFFSLLVKDLYFLNQGCSNKLPNGHINFEKFWQLAKQVTEFMAWKQVTCPFEKDQKIITVLQHGPILNENALALASFECEPPDNNQEKERCKSLKAEGGTT